MRRMDTRISTLGLALLVTLAGPALAQNKAAPSAKPAAAPAVAATLAPAPAPVAATSAAKPAAVAPASAASPTVPVAAAALAVPVTAEGKATAPKKRMIKRKPDAGCTKVDDPWDNVCAIRKNAEVACADLPTGKQAAKKPQKGSPPVSTENKRAQCVEGYMRNV